MRETGAANGLDRCERPALVTSSAEQDEQIDGLHRLLLAVGAGSQASFAELYERTHRRLFGIVLRIVLHRAEAEEVLQEIYVKVWSRSAQYDARRGLAIYWLASIAHRAALDSRRRASCRPSEVNDGADDDDSYDERASMEVRPTDVFELQQTVREQLGTLPEEEKESLLLAFVDGLTHPEIAAKLACPLGTIKSRVRSALMSIRLQMQASE